MATGPRYRVPLKRRREVRTDYQQRLGLLKAGKPRLVARTSNRHVTVQIITTGTAGDVTITSAHSSDLADFGWEAPTSNVPAAYLTGLLAGRRALDADIDEAVLDVGLRSASRGNKQFAVQEGAIDAGLDIPHNEEIFAPWERTRGEHIAAYAEQREEPLYAGEFDATTLPTHFDEIRETIMEDDT